MEVWRQQFKHHLWYTHTTFIYNNEDWETAHLFIYIYSMSSYLYFPQQPGSSF